MSNLSRALVHLGHSVEVFAGPPYPELAEGVALTRVPSLDLYRDDDPFRRPARSEFRDWIDVLEYGSMCAAGFPEPLTFSLRTARLLRARAADFDVVHDNQGLGYGLVKTAAKLPLIATVHHPIAIDRSLELRHAPDWKRRVALRRWYSFTRMQRRVARRLRRLIAVSVAARSDAIREFGVQPDRITVVHNGVDADVFRPRPAVARVPGRIITTASADVPLKGLVFLLEAVAKLRTERDVELVVVGKPPRRAEVLDAIDRFSLHHAVQFRSGLSPPQLVQLYATARVAVVPSLYEGFSLPAVEAMACSLPLVTTDAGALPEVVGRSGAALVVPAGDVHALKSSIEHLLEHSELGARMGRLGRRRVQERFSWHRAAERTSQLYQEIVSC